MPSLLDMTKSYHVAVQYFNGKVSYLTNHETIEQAEEAKSELEWFGAADGDDVSGLIILKNKEEI